MGLLRTKLLFPVLQSKSAFAYDVDRVSEIMLDLHLIFPHLSVA